MIEYYKLDNFSPGKKKKTTRISLFSQTNTPNSHSNLSSHPNSSHLSYEETGTERDQLTWGRSRSLASQASNLGLIIYVQGSFLHITTASWYHMIP